MPNVQVKCCCCQKEFYKKSWEIKKSPNHYCSRTCSVSCSNKSKPKRQKKQNVCNCGAQITQYTSRRKYCDLCLMARKQIPNSPNITLRDALTNDTQRFAKVRGYARTVFFRTKPKQCQVCGYDRHVEVAHIQDLASFDLDTPLSIVNHIDNLAGLCPNHHWEFDARILSLQNGTLDETRTHM